MDILQHIPDLKTMQKLTIRNEKLLEEVQTVCNQIMQAAAHGNFRVELAIRDYQHVKTIMTLLNLKGYKVDTYSCSLTWAISWDPINDK